MNALESIRDQKRKAILFLGASIGNFNYQEAINFLRNIGATMNTEDMFIIGFDLIKDPGVILAAYSDSAGVTKLFNLNLLERINREFGANFNVYFFVHAPHYDVGKGEARSALVSTLDQKVSIESLNLTIDLKKGEPIHTEITRKYDLEEIEFMAKAMGFEIEDILMDSNCYFTTFIWRKSCYGLPEFAEGEKL